MAKTMTHDEALERLTSALEAWRKTINDLSERVSMQATTIMLMGEDIEKNMQKIQLLQKEIDGLKGEENGS